MRRNGLLSASKKIYLPVFEWYKKQNGDLRIKIKYEIPVEAGITIPPEFYNSNKLGNYVAAIRRQIAVTVPLNLDFARMTSTHCLKWDLLQMLSMIKIREL